MKKIPSILFLISLILHLTSFSQKNKIVLKDKSEIKNVKIWKFYSNKIEYEEKESLHDLLTERIARIETDSTILSFDEAGQLYSRPYDWIIKSNDDTVHCIISQLGGNYIYYYPKGKDNRSYVPETSVKKYQVYKPEPVGKLEQGSAPYTAQVSVNDSLKETKAEIKQDTIAEATTDNIDQPSSAYKPDEQKIDSLFENTPKQETAPAPDIRTIQNDICYDSYQQGLRDANMRDETIWGISSFCLGTTSCLTLGIPTAGLTLIAANSKKTPSKIPKNVDEKCYELGYKNQRTKRRVQNVAIGGLMSSVIALGIIYVVLVAGGGF